MDKIQKEKFRIQFEKDIEYIVDMMIKHKEARENRNIEKTVNDLIDFLSKPYFGELNQLDKKELLTENSDIIIKQLSRL